MGIICNEKRKPREKKDENIHIIVSIKKYIFKVKSDLEITEQEILELKNKLNYSTTQKDILDPIKEEELKRDLYDKIIKKERLSNFKITLENNLKTIENKKFENGIGNVIHQSNQIIDNMNADNAEIILQNQYNLIGQNKQMQENDRLFKQGNEMLINAENKYERDACFKKYFGK